MKKTLPIVLENAAIVTECWTFEKLAIIQTSPLAEDWLASHFRLYIDPCFCAHFGETSDLHRPMYYDDILHSRQLDYQCFTPETIVGAVKEQIEEGRYVSLYSDWSLGRGEPRFHELLFYGYDDEQRALLAPVLRNRKFCPVWIPYAYMESTFPLVLNCLKADPPREQHMAVHYQGLMTTYSLRSDYPTDSCVYMAMDKIYMEFCGTLSSVSIIGDYLSTNDAPVYYTGSGCMKALEQILLWEIQGKPFADCFSGITMVLKTMHEHRKLLLLSMKYVQKTWALPDSCVGAEIRDYQSCCEQFQIWYCLGLKYEQTADKRILQQMVSELFSAFSKERQALQRFHRNASEYRARERSQ